MNKPAEPMFVTRWGTAGPRVVLVHGSAQGSDVGGDPHFCAQQQLGQRGWQVLVPDRPGHGRSADPGRPDDAQKDGDLLVSQFMRNSDAQGDAIHLVGHSFGACVALHAAAQCPGRVRSLTLIEPAMAALAVHQPPVRRFVFSIVRILFFSFSAQERIRRFVRLVNIPPELSGDTAPPAQLKRMGQAIFRLKLPGKGALQRQLAQVREAGIPLLVVSGGWSPAFEAISDEVAAQGGGSRRVIASPHHFPQQVSDEFNQVLAAFMQTAQAIAPPGPKNDLCSDAR